MLIVLPTDDEFQAKQRGSKELISAAPIIQMMSHSKVEFKGELTDPRISRTAYPSKASGIDPEIILSGERVEIGVVEDIEEFHAQLRAYSFSNLNILEKSHFLSRLIRSSILAEDSPTSQFDKAKIDLSVGVCPHRPATRR